MNKLENFIKDLIDNYDPYIYYPNSNEFPTNVLKLRGLPVYFWSRSIRLGKDTNKFDYLKSAISERHFKVGPVLHNNIDTMRRLNDWFKYLRSTYGNDRWYRIKELISTMEFLIKIKDIDYFYTFSSIVVDRMKFDMKFNSMFNEYMNYINQY